MHRPRGRPGIDTTLSGHGHGHARLTRGGLPWHLRRDPSWDLSVARAPGHAHGHRGVNVYGVCTHARTGGGGSAQVQSAKLSYSECPTAAQLLRRPSAEGLNIDRAGNVYAQAGGVQPDGSAGAVLKWAGCQGSLKGRPAWLLRLHTGARGRAQDATATGCRFRQTRRWLARPGPGTCPDVWVPLPTNSRSVPRGLQLARGLCSGAYPRSPG